MSTPIDLTDQFIADYQALQQQVEALKLRLASSGPARPAPQPVSEDPREIERLTKEIEQLRTDLESQRRQETAKEESHRRELEARLTTKFDLRDRLLIAVSDRRELEGRLTTARREFEQRQANDQQRITELEGKIENLQAEGSGTQVRNRPDAAEFRFEDAYPDQAEELRRLREQVWWYRSRSGPI